jgi:hypothetical protein
MSSPRITSRRYFQPQCYAQGKLFSSLLDPRDLLTLLRQRYTLWFNQPSDLTPGEPRTIKVELSGAARPRLPDAVLNAREGYVTR